MQNATLDEGQSGIKIAGRNINNLRNEDDTTHMSKSEEELKSFLVKVKEESEKACLTQHSKNEDHGKQMEKQWKQWQTLFSWGPKSLQMVIAAMKLEDTYSLEEKLQEA